DVRARLDVLSEMPTEWGRRVRLWAGLNRAKRPRNDPAPMPNDEYMIYQTMLGAWPAAMTDGRPPADVSLGGFRERLKATVLKSIREGKVRTSWSNPDTECEQACTGFVDQALATTRANPFLDDFLEFQVRIAWFGMLNGLCQIVLAQTAPGVPDIYWGGELWDLDMVDPDNRRAVDFDSRRRCLAEIRYILGFPVPERRAVLRQMLTNWADGRIKLALIAATLEVRRRERSLFVHGDYRPLEFSGSLVNHLLGFAYHYEGRWALIVAGRLFVGMIGRA